MLAQSPVFDELTAGRAPQLSFRLNDHTYENGYYLADGIYPRWSTFVKTISNPRDEKRRYFAKCQEGYRKDVERCFGILQARWGIIRGAARGWDRSDLRSIMMACIILHNMIVEDERIDEDEDLEDEAEDDHFNENVDVVYEQPPNWQFEPVGRDGHNLEGFMDRYNHIHSTYLHTLLQQELVEHLWTRRGNRNTRA